MVMPSANSWTTLTEQVQLPDSERMEMSDCNQWTHSQRCGLLKSALMQKDQEDKEPLHVWHQTHQMAEVLSQQSLLMDLISRIRAAKRSPCTSDLAQEWSQPIIHQNQVKTLLGEVLRILEDMTLSMPPVGDDLFTTSISICRISS